MALDKSAVTEQLCQEIALITRKAPEEIHPEESLRENGVDSMSFLEILLFIKNEWGIDYLNNGLPADAQCSIAALAGHICSNQVVE